MAFCIYALRRGPNRRLWPCLTRRRATPASDELGGGPDYSVWASSGVPGDWGQRVYLTDLKRQSMVHEFSQSGVDQRVSEWQSGPQSMGQGLQRWSSHTPSPLGGSRRSSSASPAATRVSPASTFHSNSHIMQQSRSPASTLSPSRPRRGTSLASSPLAAGAGNRETDSQRESFGQTPAVQATPSSRDSRPATQEVSFPPLARVAYSPFAPRSSLLGPSAQRDSIRSERGFAV